MKLGGAPGTLLECGIARDGSLCAIEGNRYELHPENGFPHHMFLQCLLRTIDCLVITLHVIAAGTLRHSPQIWLDPLIRSIIFPKEFANL